MPQTEAQKRAAKKWRDNNKEYVVKYYNENKGKINQRLRLNRLGKNFESKKALIDLYIASRSPDSPITTDEDSN